MINDFPSRSTHNTFAVALVNSDFKIAEPDYRNMEDTLISVGLDILSDVSMLLYSTDSFRISASVRGDSSGSFEPLNFQNG